MEINSIKKLIRQSLDGTKVRDMELLELRDVVSQEVFDAYADLGYDVGDSYDRLKDRIVEDISSDYPSITDLGIRAAFKIGKTKGFGKFYGLTVGTFLDWITAYQNLIRTEPVTPVENQITEKEVVTSNESYYKWLDNSIREKKKIPAGYSWSSVFEHLEEIGEIKMSDEDKEAYAENYREKQVREKVVSEKGSDAKREIDKIFKPDSLRSAIRRELVIDYFTKKYEL